MARAVGGGGWGWGKLNAWGPEYRKSWSVFNVCCERRGGLRGGSGGVQSGAVLTSLAQQEGQIASVSLFLPLSFHSKRSVFSLLLALNVQNASSFILLSFGLLR